MRQAIIGGALVLLVVAALAAPAFAETVTVPVLGGALTQTTAPTVFSSATLDGSTTSQNAQPAVPWAIVDARGTGAAWTQTISSTDFVSAAGTVDTTQHTISVSNLKISTGSVTAGVGSDPTTNITGASNLTLSGSGQTLCSSTGSSKGAYTYTPTFSLTIPANSFRANYAGAVGVSAVNAYIATLTVTTA